MPMHKVIQIFQTETCLSMKIHVHWMNLMKNQIIQKFQSFEILKEKGYKENDSFFYHLTKKMFNRFKISGLKCRSCIQEIILPKNMFGCPLKFTLGISRNFFISNYKSKYSCTILYECENSPTPHALS
jgi:hypothetical protein